MKTLLIPDDVLDKWIDSDGRSIHIYTFAYRYQIIDLKTHCEDTRQPILYYFLCHIVKCLENFRGIKGCFFLKCVRGEILLLHSFKDYQDTMPALKEIPGFRYDEKIRIDAKSQPFLYWDGNYAGYLIQYPRDYQEWDNLLSIVGGSGVTTECVDQKTYYDYQHYPGTDVLSWAIPQNRYITVPMKNADAIVPCLFYQFSSTELPPPGTYQMSLTPRNDTPVTHLMHNGIMGFYQKCTVCDWVGAGLSNPENNCPKCRSEISPVMGVRFGGLELNTDGYRVFISDGDRPIVIDAADVVDVTRFLETFIHHEKVRKLLRWRTYGPSK